MVFVPYIYFLYLFIYLRDSYTFAHFLSVKSVRKYISNAIFFIKKCAKVYEEHKLYIFKSQESQKLYFFI